VSDINSKSISIDNVGKIKADSPIPQYVGIVFRPGKSLSDSVKKTLTFLKSRQVKIVLVGEHPLEKTMS